MTYLMPTFGLGSIITTNITSGTYTFNPIDTIDPNQFLNGGGAWINGNGVPYTFQSPYVTNENEKWRKYIVTGEEEDEMEMPFYYICTANGAIVDKAVKEEDAKRKATSYAAANKQEVYVMKPVARFQPKDVPVEEVAL